MTEQTPPGNVPPQGPPPGAPQGPPPGVPQGPPGGYPPPPPAAGGYAPPPPGFGAPDSLSIGDGLSWAWNKFTKNVGPLIVPALIYGVILAVVGAVFFGVAGLGITSVSEYSSGYDYDSYSSAVEIAPWSIIVYLIGVVVLLVAAAAMMSAYIGGVLDITDGKPVTIGTFFKPRNLGAVIVAALLVGIATAVGSLVVIGAAVVSIFSLFVAVAVVDRNISAVDGFKASFDLVKNRFGDSILTWLVAGVIVSVSAMVCGIGIIVGGPVALLFLAYVWRRLTNGAVAPLTP
ncbi:MAG: hypothetical protein H6523_17490 [Mycolicibacterium sp.]|uniref:Integral membrane protein n=1 Tax=Mycolicibacterium insubricum TaxID=444597 RepID=A0A1X0DMI0_9MYCO|nr:hypothetical protein [Mycolicibacterium insubricum]MCB9442028.1 hypothetical protein [Mycolicibacterium sp.]MCV7083060.1 hypothetical protein [Mycolicibacterium insubricum]ORA73050.1 hypothetical protein BST26_03160 [Mycolicibacterium insubricum]